MKSSIGSRLSANQARTVVLRFAARDQLRTLEDCATALKRRGLLDWWQPAGEKRGTSMATEE
jgi:hypothetical protein